MCSPLVVLASVIPSRGESESWTGADVCAVTVIYEDAPSRDLALRLLDGLIKKFDQDLKFQSTWWGFKYLTDPEIAQEAGQAAAQSDLVLVAVHGAEDFPFEVTAWFDDWLPKRSPSAGALVLLQASGELKAPLPSQDRYLRSLAQRSSLEYLSLFDPASSTVSSDRLREDRVVPEAAAMEQAPRPQPHSTGWGIND